MQRVLISHFGSRIGVHAVTTPTIISQQIRCQSNAALKRFKDTKEKRFERSFSRNKKNIVEMLKKNYHQDMAVEGNNNNNHSALFRRKKAKSKREEKLEEREREDQLESENVGNLINSLFGIPIASQHVGAKNVTEQMDRPPKVQIMLKEIFNQTTQPVHTIRNSIVETLRRKGEQEIIAEKKEKFKLNFVPRRDAYTDFSMGSSKQEVVYERRAAHEFKPDRGSLAMSQILQEPNGYKMEGTTTKKRYIVQNNDTTDEQEENFMHMLISK
jgi:hypothetical protein